MANASFAPQTLTEKILFHDAKASAKGLPGRSKLFSSEDIHRVMGVAAEKEFGEAGEAGRALWETHLMEMLPRTHGRGAENFWKKHCTLQEADKGGGKGSFGSMLSPTGHALALAAMGTKRGDVAKGKIRRGRGAPGLKERNPITQALSQEMHHLTKPKLVKILGSRTSKFVEWANEEHEVALHAPVSDSEDSSQACSHAPFEEEAMGVWLAQETGKLRGGMAPGGGGCPAAGGDEALCF